MTDSPASGPASTAPAGIPAGAALCTACPLLCDDILLRDGGRVERACDIGREVLLLAGAASPATPTAWIDARPAPFDDAIAEAAALLAAARRRFVTGLGEVTIEAAAVACDLADALAAAILPGPAPAAVAEGAAIARWGEVTAAWEELRDRADLVILWGYDPDAAHPRFSERFLSPPLASGARPRRTIALRVAGSPVAATERIDLPETPGGLLAVAKILVAGLVDRPLGPVADAIGRAAGALRSAIDGADCVGIVTGPSDPAGVDRFGVIELVRALSRHRPAFEVPLGDSPAPDAAGAAAILTWRYGSAEGIGFAARAPGGGGAPGSTPAFVPTPGGGDALLALGPGLVSGGPDAPALVHVVAGVDPPPRRGVMLRCRQLREDTGTLLRADGRTIVLAGDPAARAPSARAILAAILGRLQGTDGDVPGEGG